MAKKTLPASEFKAKCLELIDRVRETAEPITITKRGRIVARLFPAADEDDRPWERLRGTATWSGDPLAPVTGEDDIKSLK
jgi:prevent-host-death family protein